MLLLQLGRTNPSLPAELVLSEDNLEILKVIGSVNYQESSNTIGEVNKIIGKIGGYIDQKKCPRLGYEVFARGLLVLEYYAEFYAALKQILPADVVNSIKNSIDTIANKCRISP